MKTDQLTFNDLPAVVGELCDRIASMGNIYTYTVMNWINGWNPPERIRLRKLLRKRTKPCSLPIAVNLTLKTGNDGEDGRNDTFT